MPTNTGKYVMKLTKTELRNLTEGGLVSFVCDFYQMKRPEYRALDVLATKVGLSVQGFSNCKVDKGSVGFVGLARLYKATKCDLIPAWMDVQWNWKALVKHG